MDVPPRREVLQVALVSGLCGLFLGIASGWQLPIESAQVLAGIVDYPRDNPFGMYHVKSFTLLHQATAALLAVGVPERVLALALGGLVGVVSFVGLGLSTYALGGGRYISCFTALICLEAKTYVEASSIYPVRILSNAPWVFYGCIATSLVLLVWSLRAVGYRRSSAFLMGLFPAIHPTMGAWCLAVGLAAWLWTWRKEPQSENPGRWLPWLAVGVTITAASLAVHGRLASDVPTVPDDVKAEYVAAFASNWDSHRQPFPLYHRVMIMACTGLVLCGVMLRYFPHILPQSSRYLLRVLLVSGALAIGLCISTQWQEHLPTMLLMAMPGRFINIIGMAFPAICLGVLHRHRPCLLAHAIFAALMFFLFLEVQRFELGWIHVPLPANMFFACAAAWLVMLRDGLPAASWHSARYRPLRWLRWGGYAMLGELLVESALYQELPFGIALCGLLGALLLRGRVERWLMRGGVDVLNCKMQNAKCKVETEPRCSIIHHFAFCILHFALCILKLPDETTIERRLIRLLTAANFASLFGIGWLTIGPGLTMALALAFLGLRWLESPPGNLAQAWLPRIAAFRLVGIPAAALVMLLTSAGLASRALAVQTVAAYRDLEDWNNHAVYAEASRGQGFLLSASTVRAMQLRTRRPVLLEGVALNQLPYVPESGPGMNEILKRVYGEDLFAWRPADWPRGGGLLRNSGRRLWEERSVADWQELAREFGFTDIITYADWRLKLPVAARADGLLLYRVPGGHEIVGAQMPNLEARKSKPTGSTNSISYQKPPGRGDLYQGRGCRGE